MSGQSGAAQYGGGRRCRGRGGGGARRAGAPPSHRGNAGSAFSTLLRLRGRLGSHLRGLRDRLVPALARRLLLRRQQPDLQLAPGADGDGRCGALRRSGPGLPLATGRERPQASLEASALLPGADSFHPGGSGAGGCFSLPQQAGDTPYVLAAQLAGTDHRPALLLPVAGRLQHTAASLGSYLAPCALQTHPHLLRLRHPPVFHGFVRGRHQREAFLQHAERDDGLQATPPRGRLCQHAGAPDRCFWGAGAGRPGQAELETPRRRLPGLVPAPAQRRALIPDEVSSCLPEPGSGLLPAVDDSSRSWMLLPASSGLLPASSGLLPESWGSCLHPWGSCLSPGAPARILRAPA